MVDPFALERLAAAAWPSAVAEERDGWLLRATPGVAHRRNNSALPLVSAVDVATRVEGAAGRDVRVLDVAAVLDPAPVERFYGDLGVDPVVAVAPASPLASLDAALEAAGWEAEGATDVLVAESASLALPAPNGVEEADPARWPDAEVRDEVLARSGGEVRAFAIGQEGAVLCIRTGEVAGVFRLHTAPASRRRGVAARLLAACARVAPVLYAQVEVDNAAGQNLFARAGLARSHGYHYRRRVRA